ncbi:LysM peptidoglycan-binding domain-containing protein [Halomonas sp. ZH2S]|uniref:LysM peptidoglycan-binding domain-containing protein n=1 Tax=Vreelandella zhuhanensis TaxID=2684210 RepID=A0A7X3H144_9GAMM|nr:LysM peptidoglycan-binding domain-containing protein [Halomonas zhuhanensis]MWJ28269.1 LysM peptidoglycan-binding domain-containing protein [Halomonas zhuhanensis]
MKVPFYLWATRAGVAKSMGIAMTAGMLLGHSVPGLAQQDQDAPETEQSVEEREKSREQLEDELSVTRSELENHKEEMQKMRKRIEYLEEELADTLEKKAAAATANDSQEETEEEGSVNLESAKDTAGETAQALADAYRRDNPEEIEQYSEQLYDDQRLVSLMQDDTTLYRVKQGESLANIAMRYYGDGNRWPEIHEANSHVIENPDRLWPRMTLLLPM